MKSIKKGFCILLCVLGSCGAELLNSCYEVTVPKFTRYLLKSAKHSKRSQTKPVALC